MPTAAPSMTAVRTLASRVVRATAAADRGANGRVADWADVLESYNRRNGAGLGAGPNPFETYAGPVPAAKPAPSKLTPAQAQYESKFKAAAAGAFQPARPMNAAVRIKLDPRAIEAVGKFLATMRPGGSAKFDAAIARDTVVRIIRYYHPQIQGLGNLGSWLSDALKGKGDNPLTKIIGIAAPVIGGVVGGSAGAATGAAVGGAFQSPQQQQPQPQPQQPAKAINPFDTLGPFLPGTPVAPVAPLVPVSTLATQQQSPPQTVIVTGGGESESFAKYAPWIIGGGLGLVALMAVMRK